LSLASGASYPHATQIPGTKNEGFRERFIQKRRATCPDWFESDRFDHDFRLMVIVDAPESERRGQIELGDSVEVLETHQF
jgi:hypothetical protein